jgi:hypothetical protein
VQVVRKGIRDWGFRGQASRFKVPGSGVGAPGAFRRCWSTKSRVSNSAVIRERISWPAFTSSWGDGCDRSGVARDGGSSIFADRRIGTVPVGAMNGYGWKLLHGVTISFLRGLFRLFHTPLHLKEEMTGTPCPSQTTSASRREGAGFGCGVRRKGVWTGSGYLRLPRELAAGRDRWSSTIIPRIERGYDARLSLWGVPSFRRPASSVARFGEWEDSPFCCPLRFVRENRAKGRGLSAIVKSRLGARGSLPWAVGASACRCADAALAQSVKTVLDACGEVWRGKRDGLFRSLRFALTPSPAL